MVRHPKRLDSRLLRLEEIARERERYQFLAGLDPGWRVIHRELAERGFLSPLPPELEPTPAQIEASLTPDPEDRELGRTYFESLTDAELQLGYLAILWPYLLQMGPHFGLPNWRPRFLQEAREAAGQSQLTDAEIEALLEVSHCRLEAACAQGQATD